jgi:hypothetical protein
MGVHIANELSEVFLCFEVGRLLYEEITSLSQQLNRRLFLRLCEYIVF